MEKLNVENDKWFGLLVANEDDKETFYNNKNGFNSQSDGMLKVLEYRRYLLDKGRGQNLTEQELSKVTLSKDKSKLIQVLSELFLEPLSTREVQYYIDSAISADELIQLHKNHLNLRFSSILTGYKILLVQDSRNILNTAS